MEYDPAFPTEDNDEEIEHIIDVTAIPLPVSKKKNRRHSKLMKIPLPDEKSSEPVKPIVETSNNSPLQEPDTSWLLPTSTQAPLKFNILKSNTIKPTDEENSIFDDIEQKIEPPAKALKLPKKSKILPTGVITKNADFVVSEPKTNTELFLPPKIASSESSATPNLSQDSSNNLSNNPNMIAAINSGYPHMNYIIPQKLRSAQMISQPLIANPAIASLSQKKALETSQKKKSRSSSPKTGELVEESKSEQRSPSERKSKTPDKSNRSGYQQNSHKNRKPRSNSKSISPNRSRRSTSRDIKPGSLARRRRSSSSNRYSNNNNNSSSNNNNRSRRSPNETRPRSRYRQSPSPSSSSQQRYRGDRNNNNNNNNGNRGNQNQPTRKRQSVTPPRNWNSKSNQSEHEDNKKDNKKDNNKRSDCWAVESESDNESQPLPPVIQKPEPEPEIDDNSAIATEEPVEVVTTPEEVSTAVADDVGEEKIIVSSSNAVQGSMKIDKNEDATVSSTVDETKPGYLSVDDDDDEGLGGNEAQDAGDIGGEPRARSGSGGVKKSRMSRSASPKKVECREVNKDRSISAKPVADERKRSPSPNRGYGDNDEEEWSNWGKADRCEADRTVEESRARDRRSSSNNSQDFRNKRRERSKRIEREYKNPRRDRSRSWEREKDRDRGGQFRKEKKWHQSDYSEDSADEWARKTMQRREPPKPQYTRRDNNHPRGFESMGGYQGNRRNDDWRNESEYRPRKRSNSCDMMMRSNRNRMEKPRQYRPDRSVSPRSDERKRGGGGAGSSGKYNKKPPTNAFLSDSESKSSSGGKSKRAKPSGKKSKKPTQQWKVSESDDSSSMNSTRIPASYQAVNKKTKRKDKRDSSSESRGSSTKAFSKRKQKSSKKTRKT